MKRPIDVYIGKRIKLLGEKGKLSCSNLEVSANIGAGLIAMFEEGAVTIKANELSRIADVLMTSIGFFYREEIVNQNKINTPDFRMKLTGAQHHEKS